MQRNKETFMKGLVVAFFGALVALATGVASAGSLAPKQVEPFRPPMTNHAWFAAGPDRLVFIHYDAEVSKATTILFIGDGVKGRFCAQDQPDGGKTGYVHFHRAKAAKGEEHGHGGHTGGEEGYWLRHVAVGEFEMMGMRFAPGIALNFMPTPPPRCA